MSATAVQVPFPVFQDRNGEPLENGYVWIGQANLNPQTNPVQVYFDREKTRPAAQPLRTIAGYISNSGTPAQIFVDAANFSILVQDKNGTMVYNLLDSTGFKPDACGIEYTAPFSGAVAIPLCVKLAESTSVLDFGAIGDGVADDTTAIQTAVNSGTSLNWGSGVYRITQPLEATVAKLDWVGDGATIFYDGPYAREAVRITCAIRADHNVSGITFDANRKAHVAAKFIAATVGEPITQWPSFYASNIIAKNAYRASTTFLDGDGLMINGGFNYAQVDNIRVFDCFMAPGALVLGSQGIFGITFGSNGARRCRNVRLSNYHIENVWSENPLETADQDGVRIFQETAERTSTCFVLNGTVKNVANRAIKLHSGVNALVDGLYRELSSSVVPQSGSFGNPDIDSQQCPATVTNCRFHYDGAWHNTLVQNYTERPSLFRYGGTVVDNITGRFVNVAGSTIRVVAMTGESTAPTTKHLATISNIAIDGPITYFASILIRGAVGTNSVSITNAVAEVTNAAVQSLSGNARLRVTASNLHNSNFAVPVPLGENFASGDRELFVAGYYGFTSVGAAVALGVGTDNAYGDPGPGRIGPSRIGAVIPSDVGFLDTDIVLLLAPTADPQSHVSGAVQLYRGSATSAGGGTLNLFVMKDAATGDAAGNCTFSGAAVKTASLITCTFGGVQRFGVRISGGGTGIALARAFYSGNYQGSADLRLVPTSAVSGIAAFVQRSGYEQTTAFLQPIRLASFTVATLPAPANYTGAQVFVSNASGGAQPAYSDGTNWRRYSDGAVVS